MCVDCPLLCAAAPAKINLFLKVTGKRDNGYHELKSLFLPLTSPADDIAIDLDALPGAITVASSDIMLPGGLKNIAGKAAELWAKRSAVMPHWDINIAKNIPVAGGLGGGSSDAATVLKMLNEHYGKPLSDKELCDAALELGADVPFFLQPQPSIVTGIGEISQKLDFPLPLLHLLLVNPAFPVSAAEGYRLLDKSLIAPMKEELYNCIISALQQNDVEKLAKHIFNDLESGVIRKYPILEILKKSMLDSGALTAIMSGSGPTMFALYSSAESMENSRRKLQEKYSEFVIMPGIVCQ